MSTTTPSISRLQKLLPELFQPSKVPGDRYLRFQLTSSISGLISMTDVQESLLVSSSNITPIPNMSSSVMGLMSSRERVFCVIDLAELTGSFSLSPYLQEYHVIVLNLSNYISESTFSSKQLLLGVAVNQVEGITRVISEQIQSLQSLSLLGSKNFMSSLIPYLKGYIIDKENFLLVFDTLAIVNLTHNS